MAMNSDLVVPGFNQQKCEHLEIKLQKIDKGDHCLSVHLTGFIDSYNSQSFQKKILKLIEAGFTKLIFNCRGLTYVSSTGIGSFTALLQCIKNKGGDIVFIEVQPKVKDVFDLLGFLRFFKIAENLEQACRFLQIGKDIEKENVFPLIFYCPNCSKKLKAHTSGRFRCSECKGIIIIDSRGRVSSA